MVCMKCGQELPGDSQFCFACGEKFEVSAPPSADERFCIQCGQKLLGDSEFCFQCGAKTVVDDTPQADESFCVQCGQKLLGDSQFCFSCGAAIPPADPVPSAPAPPPPVRLEEPVKVAREPIAPVKPVVEEPPPPPAPPEKADDKQAVPRSQRGIIFALVGVVVVLLAVIIGFVVINFMGDEGGEPRNWPFMRSPGQVTFDFSDVEGGYYISRVANGYLPEHPHMNIGTALTRYFSRYQWSHQVDDGGNVYVHFNGDAMIHQEADHVEIIFQFSWDGTRFDLIGMIINGNWVDHRFMLEMFDVFFLDS